MHKGYQKVLVTLLALASLSAHATERLIAIGGPVTEIVYALGAGDRLVATDTSSIYPKAATELPQVGYQRSLSAEGVLSQRPDQLLLSAQAGPKKVIEQLRQSNITVSSIPTANTLAQLRDQIQQIAAAVTLEHQGDRLIAQIDTQLNAIKPLQRQASPRLLFVLQMGHVPMIAGQKTVPDELFRLAGATNAGAQIQGFKPLTPEALIAARPDAIVVTTQGSARHGGTDALWQLPGIAQTPAGKQHRLITLDALQALALGPRTPQTVTELIAQVRQQLP